MVIHTLCSVNKCQDVDQLDGVESDQCSIEDYHYIVNKVYSMHAVQPCDDAMTDSTSSQYTASTPTVELSPEGRPVFMQLSEQGRAVLNHFAVQNHFSKITQKLM